MIWSNPTHLVAQNKAKTPAPKTAESKKKDRLNQKLNILKPPVYQDMELPVEKSLRKKNTALRRWYHNTITRYNFIYNCQRILSTILDSAKEDFHDDYTLKPIPFYPYSTSFIQKQFSKHLDSILNKATAGVLLHSIHSKWVDDLYLLMGKAYFYKKDYDSAMLMFQYINFQFDEKYEQKNYITDQGVKKLIAAPTLVNREESGTMKAKLKHHPARNEALLWLIRVYTEQEEYENAANIIDALNKDIFFPERLKPLFAEIKAYYDYKKNDYTSCAQNLTQTIDLSRDRQEKARRCFLIAQLYTLTDRQDLATQYLRDASRYTYDPVLEIYAKLNFVLQEKHPNIYVINDHIAEMLALLKKERFKRYKYLIYYACSFMALKKDDIKEAIGYIQKSALHIDETSNIEKDRIYFQLFDMLWAKKNYPLASAALDSVSNAYFDKDTIAKPFLTLKPHLKKLSMLIAQKENQDSLQKIARMSELDRQRLVKQMTKDQYALLQSEIKRKKQQEVIQKIGETKTNAWYFDNPQSLQTGSQQFQNFWGNRKNEDNWRRKSSSSFDLTNEAKNTPKKKLDSFEMITFKEFEQKILKDIPLTQEQKLASDKIIITCLYQMAEIYFLHIKDYPKAKEIYKDLLVFYPKNDYGEDVFLNQYFVLKALRDDNFQQDKDDLIKRYNLTYPQGKYRQLFNPVPYNERASTKELDAYHAVLTQYKLKTWTDMTLSVQAFLDQFPESTYTIHIHVLKALSLIEQQQKQEGIQMLQTLKTKTPDLSEKWKNKIDQIISSANKKWE